MRRRIVHASITMFRGIGTHYHALLEESGVGGMSFGAKFDSRMAAETRVLRMARKHFPVRPHKLVHSSREGPWFYRERDDCLRSFSIPAEKTVRVLRELRTLECIFCDTPIQFIVEETPEALGLPTIKKDRTA